LSPWHGDIECGVAKRALSNAMQIHSGIAVSPGVAICEALVIDQQGLRISRRAIPQHAVAAEIARLEGALAAVGQEIAEQRDSVNAELGAQYGAIFSAHVQMISDPQLLAGLHQLIRSRHCSAEFAVRITLQEYAQVFERLDNRYMAERAHDIYDIEKLLLKNLLGRQPEIQELAAPAIVLAHRLTPSETANLNREFVKGFVTEVGGAGGHTAIVAEGLEIPAVVGVGGFLSNVSTGDLVIIDGDTGRVVLRPDETTLAHYRQEEDQQAARFARLAGLRKMPAETQDGQRIHLAANIEFPSEVMVCLERGCDGIGLYRTEFLYLRQDCDAPTEDEQFSAYRHVATSMGQRPVIIRTNDLGADKQLAGVTSDERNPVLGLRSIRLSLRNLATFKPQLRAILRASNDGDIWMMFPMICALSELLRTKEILAEVMDELDAEGIAFNRHIPVGMMVEVPSVAITLDRYVDEIDFISIGTNDLTQYTLAVDRGNTEVADLYNAADPAVLRLIKMTIDAASKADLYVGLCGQMSANPIYAPLLIGLGLRNISVPPYVLPEIKQACRSVTVAQCEQIAGEVMEMKSASEINRYLETRMKQFAPELTARV
jgi:phosphotransferase system enzyme I (PtsI)